jgi:hypothetical protein
MDRSKQIYGVILSLLLSGSGLAAPSQTTSVPTTFVTPASLTISVGVPLLGTWDFTGATVIGVGGGAGTWGSITGTLSNQTDLQTALNAKASSGANSDITSLSGLTGQIATASTIVQRYSSGPSTSNAIGLSLSHTNGLTVGSNFGIGIDFSLDDTVTSSADAGQLNVRWSNATGATHASYMDFLLDTAGGSPTSVARLFGSGGLSVNSTTDPGAGIINANTGFKVAGSQIAFSNLAGNIAVSQMNSGTSASSSTFWRGDGTWASAGGGTITLSGDATGSGTTAITVTNVNLPTGVTMAGSLLATAIAVPGTPASGKSSLYVDSTTKTLASIDDSGQVRHNVKSKGTSVNNFLTGLDDNGTFSAAQPAFSNLSGTATDAQLSVGAIARSIVVENPTASENIPICFMTTARTISKVHAVLVGSSSPSVTYNIKYGTDVTSLTSVTTTPSALTSTTTGTDATLNNTSVPASGWLVFTTSAQSGTVNTITVTVEF